LNAADVPHISSETLEDFVLEKLPPDERASVERHVATCASCRTTLEEERQLAAGIRSSGRAALKSRLAESLVTSGQETVPWGKILSAAAVLMLITGIGLVYRWLTPVEQFPQVVESITHTQADKAPGAPPPATEPQPSRRLQEKISPVPALTEQTASGTDQTPSGTGQSASRTKQTASRTEQKASRSEQTASDVEGMRLKDALSEEKVTAGAETPEVAFAPTVHRSIWQTGQLTENPEPDQDYLWLKSDQQPAPHAAGAQMQKRQDLAGAVHMLPRTIVRVSPLLELPLSGTAGRTRAGTYEIPTHITQSPDSVVFTLYTDLPLEGQALRDAQLRQVTPDSVVLTIGGRSISYRLSLPASR